MRRIRNIVKELDEKEKGCTFSLQRLSRFIQPSLLLFLSKGQCHGYDLIEKLGVLGFHKEAIDIGAVYRTLRKLEKEGYVKSFWSSQKGRKRRVYRITSRGRTLLKFWIERVKERKEALNKFIIIYQEDKL